MTNPAKAIPYRIHVRTAGGAGRSPMSQPKPPATGPQWFARCVMDRRNISTRCRPMRYQGEKCSDRRWRRSEWLLCEIEAVRHVVGRPVTSVNGLETEGLFAEPDDADMRVLDV